MKSLVKVLLCLAAFSPLSMNAQFWGNGCCNNDYYFSVWGGGNVPFNTHNHHRDHDLDTGWYVGGALGYRSPCSCLRYDVSFDYLRNEIDRNSGNSGDLSSNSSSNNDINKYVALVNAYYDFCPCGCLVPFVGAGVGYAYVSHGNNHNNNHHNKNRSAFAWQVGAGLSYEINECWSATAAYRLLGVTHDGSVYHNLFGIGLTRQF